MLPDNSNAADTSTSDDAQGETSSGEPDGTETPEKLKAEFAEATKRRDAALTRARQAEAKLKAYESEQSKRSSEEAEKSGDLEKYKANAQKEIDKREARIAELEATQRKHVVETAVRSAASQHAISADQVWGLIGSQFEVGTDDDGNMVAVVKDSPVSVEKHILEYLDKNPNLAKNKGVAGSGAGGPGSATGANGATLPGGLTSKEAITKWYLDHPGAKPPKI